jgi:pimeloyl-ACP methyl ester carboxylesterase
MIELGSSFRVIAMDQRNAGGRSRAPITARDGWHTYTGDHIAVLDHLGIDRCHLYGQCIGGSFIMSMLKTRPERVVSAVLA